ncbi:MAG: extracellular solute-binding protein [Anaerolineales bacterium]|nr:extracellular solute-binding protein [Anaerolineales bacterium]
MNRKFWALISLLLVAALLLTACGQQPSGGESAVTGPVTIRFFHKWPEPEHMEFYNFVIQEYEKTHPNVKIVMESVADEPYKDKIRVLMASGEVPDIYFSWAGEFSWKFARGGQALDLTDAVMNSDWKDKIILSAVEPYKWQGKIYGVPMRINAKFMVYNKAMFEQYGLQPPTTWDEFLAVCETLKQNGVTPIAFGDEFPWAASHYIGDFNAKLVDPAVRQADYLLTAPAEQLFTDPGYVEALSRFQLLMDKGYFNEGPNGISHSGARSSFIAGKAGMMYIELEEFVTVADGMGADAFGFFQFPSGTGGKGDQKLLTGAPDGFMVYSKTKHPQEAIDFLKFLTSPEMGKEYVKRLGIPSAAVGAVSTETALPIVVAGVESINTASGMALWLDTDINIKIVEVYLPGMQAVLNGTKTPQQVMSEVQEAAKTVQQELKNQ